jgi:hypothetical protein
MSALCQKAPRRLSQFRHGIWPSRLRVLVFLTIPTHHTDAGLWGIRGMRPSSLAYILPGLLGVLTIAATYRILNQSPFPKIPTDQFDVSGQHPFEQKSDPLQIYKDESRLQDGDVAPANVNPDELTIAKDKVQPEDRNQSPPNQSSDLKDIKQNLSYLAYYAYSEVPPGDQTSGHGSQVVSRHSTRHDTRRNKAGGGRVRTGLQFHESNRQSRVRL